uniref:Cytochrome oxidase maturation protein cbb3-type (Modular protein) n=1 Tax=Magnetococcus massalia (strain MO-1) TaxID=451514 RepID=A0A1S7LH13_MAGMO|nr:Cytochrome oxidase maturation protein cbb3-type (modular protein) [Candidatus Magnetococcus massalia]
METIYFLLPLALFLGMLGLGMMIWAWKTGQFDDMEGPAHRILFDDDDEKIPHSAKAQEAKEPKDGEAETEDKETKDDSTTTKVEKEPKV